MSKKHLYFSQMKLLDTFLYLISTTISESNSVVYLLHIVIVYDLQVQLYAERI